MGKHPVFAEKSLVESPTILKVIAGCVLLTGLLTVLGVLFAQVSFLHGERIVSADAQFTLLVGITFIYLASLLERGKRRAWLVSLPLYGYIVVRNFQHYLIDQPDLKNPLPTILHLVVPLIALIGLIIYRNLYNVRSDSRNFMPAVRRTLLVLLVAFLFGVLGFMFMDDHDFHQELSFRQAAHYTIDQFGLTSDQRLTPYTRRAQVFIDSLNLVSMGAIFYVGLSLFGPISFRLRGQQHDRDTMIGLIAKHSDTSEDFFKLWPHDKAYYFNTWRSAGLAYHVTHGIALVVGDPVGNQSDIEDLLITFTNFCQVNDWLPAFIHTDPTHSKLYEKLGYEQQKIGEEAIIDTAHFVENVKGNKYFRQINNRFTKQNYTCKLYSPPHSDELMNQLRHVSQSWLKIPGRAERTFMMGYFTAEYIQQCNVMVVEDEAGTVQAFINQIPSYIEGEANYDFLRHTMDSPGNINDFLMMNFIVHIHEQGIGKFNMGLCPLAGLEVPEQGEKKSRFDTALEFLYQNANRFYSFKGLYRFKNKYEPKWDSRYIVYRGGLSGFTRTLNALRATMHIKRLKK